ncbi:hypothetical protein H2200_010901 [Cladophialophora chaetospira]|uniref:Uncharacterized protein n=1 Tax=Cladophialophora chaetospira TaxID=386627 RepID=A0AA38X0Y7_9EURO|nr:hypothetical protein H2200_010901 [Cladophialophora chaetospira]
MDEVVNISSTISTNIQKTSHDISSLRTDFTTVQDELHTLNSTIDPGIQMILQQVDELSKQIALIQPSPATPVDILHRMDIRTQTLQQQLVSKLSLFQTFCIESQSSDVDTTAKPSSDEFSTPACNCRYRSPRYKLNKRRVFFDYSHLAEHDKHCLFYVEGMKQRNLRVKFSYCSQLISRSIRIVAAMTTKAGGKSMSAQIDWIPIVSRSTSPAMQLLLQLGDSIRDETRPPEALESVREDLLKLFAQGKAHPRETDQDGLTLLDVCMLFNLRGTETIKEGGASLVNQKDEAGRLPLSYAMTFMQQDERWRTFLGPSGSARRQDSLTAIKLLFAAGTAIANTELARNEFTGVIAGLLTTGSTSMADHLLGALTNRRQRLQRLGEIHLSFRHGDARRRTPYEVLDERAFQVVSALSEVGVEVPPALATLEKQCTIWHDSAATMSVDMAKMLWTAGFRDVEGLDEKGCTCLMTLNRSYWNDDIERILSFGDWLCEQGADLSATFLDAKYFVAIQLDIKDQGN